MTTSEQFAIARRHMVESQLRPNRLTDDRIAQAMAELPRELFVPKRYRGVAYLDDDIGIAPGRYLMEPMVLAKLLQAAEVGPEDTVLDVGCGTGYSTAVIGRCAGAVVALESDAELAARATELLAELQVDNAAVVEGPLPAGLPDQGPYDVIVVNGAVAEVPETLIEQIAEGGRLVAVLSGDGVGHACLIARNDGLVSRRPLFDAATPALPGFESNSGFVF